MAQDTRLKGIGLSAEFQVRSIGPTWLFAKKYRMICCPTIRSIANLQVFLVDIEGYLVELRQNDQNRNPSTRSLVFKCVYHPDM